MDALKLSRKFEAKKISPQTVHLTRREEVDRKKAWREYEISQLQIKIVLATNDHPKDLGRITGHLWANAPRLTLYAETTQVDGVTNFVDCASRL
jgi:hypothetical protein